LKAKLFLTFIDLVSEIYQIYLNYDKY